MAVEEVREHVHEVATVVRVPREIRAGKPDDITGEVVALTAQEKVSYIENYMVDIAEARGVLEADKLVLLDALHELQEQGRNVPWQNYVQKKSPTQVEIAEAKRRAAPDLCHSIDTAKHLLELLRAQLGRLEADHEAMSRVYTVVTGG